MKYHIRPDVLLSALDEVDAIVEGLDHVDSALGAYLVRCLTEPDQPARHSVPIGTPGWYRARILEWCRAPYVRTAFSRDAVESTRMAVPELTDDELRLLVADLVERGTTRVTAVPVGRVSAPAAAWDASQSRMGRHKRLRGRRR